MTTASYTAILDSLASYLSRSLNSGSLSLDRSQADGRLNSHMNERQISDALRLYALANEQFQSAQYSIDIAPPRFWYDFLVSGPEKAQAYILGVLRQTFVLRAKALGSFDDPIPLHAAS